MYKKINIKRVVISISVIIIIGFLMITLVKGINRKIELSELTITNQFKQENEKIFENDKLKIDSVVSNEKYKKELKWESSDTTIATVDNNGNVTALKDGTVTIFSYVEGCQNKGKTTITINKYIPLEKIHVNHTQIKMTEGDTQKLKYTLEPTNVSKSKIVFSSADSEIATVDQYGKISAIQPGNTNIIIEDQISHKQQKIDLTVNKKVINLKSLSFKNKDNIVIENGQSYKSELVLYPKDATEEKIVYKSSNPNIASIDENGIISTKRPGFVVVTATSQRTKKVAKTNVNIKSDNGLINNQLLSSLPLQNAQKLMIVAHPDDETLWGGGHLLDGGWFVVCLTNGYNTQRVNEFHNAMKVSGNSSLILNYPDYKINKTVDNWEYVKNGITKDVQKLISYKNWNQIVTHNPQGEYGHKHHKMTNKYVTLAARNANAISNLYYFGKFYKPNQVPSNLPKSFSEERIQAKIHMINQYPGQMKYIKDKWAQMIPYEHWIKA